MNYFFLDVFAVATAVLKLAPAENFGTVAAGMLIFSPVR